MPRLLPVVLTALWLAAPAPTAVSLSPPADPVLVIESAKGVIEVQLSPADAPKTVEHIVALAQRNFYRGQRFHWVQPGVVQFGDPQSRDLTKRNTWGTGGSGLRFGISAIGVAELSKKPFARGVVGVAYRPGSKPESADSQIFILTAANPAMVGKYAQIGKVTKGLAIVDTIAVEDVIRNVTVR